jgi:hypothetical protein
MRVRIERFPKPLRQRSEFPRIFPVTGKRHAGEVSVKTANPASQVAVFKAFFSEPERRASMYPARRATTQ